MINETERKKLPKSGDATISEIIGSLLVYHNNFSTRKTQDVSIEIEVSKFKRINSVKLRLDPVNIFIGANNSGKSSFIQGIQFAISSCQTLELKKVNWVRKSDSRTLSLDSSDFLYTPTRQIEHLYHGNKLTGAKTKGDRKSVSFKFRLGNKESSLQVSRGKNGGFTTNHHGRSLGEMLNNVGSPFCVYVPGIAGIPIVEKFEVPISIKKSATRGDSNSYLRNIILRIYNDSDSSKWSRFQISVNRIYPSVVINVSFDENLSEYINVWVTENGLDLPIDSIGTGVLQTIQIFAYIEYFNPQILLLDEPDSHVHPTKQRLLANELYDRAQNDSNLRIVFSTHSRYILDALEGRAQVVHFQEGKAYTDIRESKILLDIGAADADYLFSKRHLKYVIVTEDKVDNIEQKKEFLKKFILANGLTEDEFVLHSYEGCSKVHFAKLLEGFVRKHIPHAKVIVHIDRDQRVDADRDIIKLTEDCFNQDIKLFVTEFSEIENYFCQPNHINHIYKIDNQNCKEIYQKGISELESVTRNKIMNFLLNERIDLCKKDSKRTDVKILNAKCEEYYLTAGESLTPGKELIGIIKRILQTELKMNPLEITNVSPGLVSELFKSLL